MSVTDNSQDTLGDLAGYYSTFSLQLKPAALSKRIQLPLMRHLLEIQGKALPTHEILRLRTRKTLRIKKLRNLRRVRCRALGSTANQASSPSFPATRRKFQVGLTPQEATTPTARNSASHFPCRPRRSRLLRPKKAVPISVLEQCAICATRAH